MKDRPEAQEPQPDNPVDPGPACPPYVASPYREMHLYVLLFVSFTTGAAISIIVNEALTATGSPLDTVHDILQNMCHAAGAGAVFAVTMAFVFKTVRLVSRCLRRLPFRSRQGRTESDQSEKE